MDRHNQGGKIESKRGETVFNAGSTNSASTFTGKAARPEVVKVKQEPDASIKPEPIDSIIPQGFSLLAAISPTSSLHTFKVDPDGQPNLAKEPPAPAAPAPAAFTLYNRPNEIVYTPEQALKEGRVMVEVAKVSIANLHVTNKMRQDVWNRELQKLQKTAAQKIMIALCGATGAGKSSVINAILDDNIVPTSGMRACTATVTEIAYHTRSTIDADIQFLTTEEWRVELSVLQDDLQDEDGNFKRASDKRTDAGIAWHKVHAVYPALTAAQLLNMTVDEIIASDPKIARTLDTTKHLRCANSKEFSKEINRYIDSKNQKRSEKKDKKKKNKEEPEYWPLIKQVKVWVKADALSTGAVLCDLPGTADSNAARSNIAKEYMKLADCIWILAPIHRAVDDKTAKDLLGEAFKTQLLMDGNYDGSTVTFIATKADDVAASEVVRALDLEDDPNLVPLEAKIDDLKGEIKTAKKLEQSTSAEIKSLDKQIERHKAIRTELEDHLDCLETGKRFIPRLTAKKNRQHGDNPKKRKAIATGGRSNAKRRKSSGSDLSSDEASESGSDNESFIATSEVETDELEEDSESEGSENHRDSGKRSKLSKSKSSRHRRSTVSTESDASDQNSEESEELEDSDSDEEPKSKSRAKPKKRTRQDSDDDDSDVESADDDDDAETEASLKPKIASEKATVVSLRSKVAELKEQRKEAKTSLAKTKKKLSSVQREKNAFCALKRAEYSRDVLKVDFRTGLRELDEQAALERDAESFDPTIALRDYDAIDLPVFCVSARDYARINNLNRGDGDPTTFSDEDETEVPALRDWCKHLTVASRERAAKVFFDTLQVFVQSVLSYVQGLDGISEKDRQKLRLKWQTPPVLSSDSESDRDNDDPYAWLRESDNEPARRTRKPRRDSKGNLIGIYARLESEFEVIIEDNVESLKERFKDGLQSKCAEGVQIAAESALEISDEFAQRIPWQTYRATLRRDGTFREDLNELLCMPLTKRIASSWARVFEANLFVSIDKRILSSINNLVNRMEKSTNNIGLKEKCQLQGQLALEEAKVELGKLVATVSQSLQSQQKEISRCIAPTVKEELHDGYLAAVLERGRGSVVRQKHTFRSHLTSVRDDMFEGCSGKLFSQLDNASAQVKDRLDDALEDLAQKVEVNMSILWEGASDTVEQRKARANTRKDMLELSTQISFWQQASQVTQGLGTTF